MEELSVEIPGALMDEYSEYCNQVLAALLLCHLLPNSSSGDSFDLASGSALDIGLVAAF